VGERLRVQSAGGAVYLRASEPIEPTRLQLQDADTGALILLDIAAEPPKDGEAELEPVRIVEGSVALPVDKRVWGRNGCQFFKRDGFVLTIHKTGRQKTA